MGRIEKEILLAEERKKTRVVITESILADPSFMRELLSLAPQWVVITDKAVEKTYGQQIEKAFLPYNISPLFLSIPPGESYKSRESKAFLEDQLIKSGKTKDTAILALGGGVISDLAGFVASTYCRGIPFVILPTTLLSMVDACLGGKTGVDACGIKNIIGSFYPPSLIGIDPLFLSTLPPKEFRSGLAEVIKAALIADPALFSYLLSSREKILARDPHSLQHIIDISLTIKQEIIEKDPKEQGLRRVLNLGHTIGHAIESIESFTLTHGEAVAIGIDMEGYISTKMGLLAEDELHQIVSLLKLYGFPLVPPSKIDLAALISIMKLDKKSVKEGPRFVLLEKIGKVFSFEGKYCTFVDREILREALNWIYA